MQQLPHRYTVAARGESSGSLNVSAPGVPDLECTAPVEFGGPGDRWSPEGLLCAAVAGCFVLSFRAVARASKLEWRSLECSAEGLLERIDGVMQFTRVTINATLTVDPGVDANLCRRVLLKAEQGCLIANSLRSRRELQAVIRIGSEVRKFDAYHGADAIQSRSSVA
jgi:organic hydroperoxide reductase OsmC/OhrA